MGSVMHYISVDLSGAGTCDSGFFPLKILVWKWVLGEGWLNLGFLRETKFLGMY